jgi:hypothetical protein
MESYEKEWLAGEPVERAIMHIVGLFDRPASGDCLQALRRKPGPMKLFLRDMALERARLALARIEAFAPLNGLIDDSPPQPIAPDAVEAWRLKGDVAKQLAIASDYIESCGYHRRDEELAELQAVLRSERKFADLPPRL